MVSSQYSIEDASGSAVRNPMKLLLRNSVFATLFTAGMLLAQQDMTAEWKTSLTDLERRISGLSSKSSVAVEAWRADAEALRSSLAAFGGTHSDVPLHLPEPLPERPPLDALRTQLDLLNNAVNEVIRRTPGSPFNLGRVEITVSGSITAPSPVADSIDQSEIRNLNLT